MPDTLVITAIPNPFPVREQGILRDFIGNAATYYTKLLQNRERGMLISVLSTQPLEVVPDDPDSYGTALVYDAVGNIVKRLNLQRANDFESTTYGMIWDGTNDQNRTVAGGVYLLKLKILFEGGISRVLTKKIGIRF